MNLPFSACNIIRSTRHAVVATLVVTTTILLSTTCSNAVDLDVKAAAGQRLKTIIVNNYHPYTFLNGEGKPDGFSVEIVKAVSKAMDIKLDIRADKWDAAMKELEAGSIDLLPMMAYSPERDKIFDFSVPHTIAFDAIFTRKSSPAFRTFKNLSGKTVIVMNKDIAHSYLLSSGLSKTMTIHLVDSLPEALKQLASGIGDAAIMPKLVGLLEAKRLNIAGIETSPQLIDSYTRPFCFAVKEGNQALLERLNQGLNIIKNSGEYDAIYKKWFGAFEEPHIDWKEFITYGFIIVLLLFGFLIWNVILKRQVKAKIEHLEKEIAERRQAEELLRESEKKYRTLFESAGDAIIIHDMQAKILGANPLTCQRYGFTLMELMSMTVQQLDSPEQARYIPDRMALLKAHGHLTFETVHLRKDGSSIPTEANVQVITWQGQPTIMSICRDITERKQYEEQIKSLAERLQLATSSVNLGIWDWNVRDNHMIWNDPMFDLYGVKPDTFPSNVDAWTNGLHPEDKDRAISECEAALRGEKKFDTIFRVLNPDGTVKHLKADAIVIRGTDGTAERMIGINADITDIILTREDLDKANKLRLSVLNSISDAFFSMDNNMVVTYFNDSAERILYKKREEVIGNRLFDVFPEARGSIFDEKYSKALKEKIALSFETHFTVSPYENWYVVGVYPYEDGISVYFQTITDRKRAEQEMHDLEQQFQQTQKLESLGVLAGGIAHDFNNILAIIMGNCSLAKMDTENAENYLSEIERATDRAAALCRQMLTYAGKAQLAITQINMWALVDEMISMLKATLPQNAEIKPYLSAYIPHVNGDASQIRQIVMNLIINASEAIGDKQGEIRISLTKTIRTENQPDKDYHSKDIPAGEYLCLEVTDTGCGMDEETKWRIFEPFYTTKFTGRGLGMSAVLGIIMSHRGALQLYSQLGQGTTFKVYLPTQTSDSTDDNSILTESQTTWQGSGTVLLAEDEDQIRHIAKTMLGKFGFAVIEAVNGKEALELYKQNSTDIKLVLSDMGMPIMDGYTLFHELKKLDPELPIIVSSGFGDADVTSRIGSDNIAGLINKPYNPSQLRDVLKRVLSD
jgi:PAS domain S-box-containing protein